MTVEGEQPDESEISDRQISRVSGEDGQGGLDIVGILFAILAAGCAVLGAISTVFPWYTYGDWTWWDWDNSALAIVEYHRYEGIGVLVFSVVALFSTFLVGALKISGSSTLVATTSRIILFSGGIVTILSLLDTISWVAESRYGPGLGGILALCSGLGLVMAGSVLIFTSSWRAETLPKVNANVYGSNRMKSGE